MTELLWGGHQPRGRGPKPVITLAAVAEAGIRIADTEGLDAVSMQRVADELPVTKMALYRHVPGKAELVAVMSDLAIGPPPEHDPMPWRAALKTWALDLYAAFAAHPWLLRSTIGRRLLGPNELTWMEHGLAALTDSGLDGGEQFDSILLLSSHVRNLAQQTLDTGLTEAHLNQAFAEILATEADRFPSLAAAMRTAGRQDQGLEFGLDRILDGLELHLSAVRG
ncbi:TetR/AcrR family transcriptional regulator [Kribbella sp. CA-247076]|uniref:TetR/AcrR family transcriptional regulator n=1 Tax=Kribbella sp. CA-247076 TaxID=3239941 RepID=UPI003D8F6200